MGYIKPKEIQKRIHGVHENPIRVGYDKTEKFTTRKVGDIWTDDKEQKWEQKNGYVVRVTKFDDLRIPLFCPNCQKPMGKAAKDEEVYYKFGFCLNCLVERDIEMIRNGTYDEYKRNYMKSKQEGFYKEAKIQIEEFLKTFEKGYLEFPNEDGKMERWSGDVSKLKEFWEKELEQVNTALYNLEHNYENVGKVDETK